MITTVLTSIIKSIKLFLENFLKESNHRRYNINLQCFINSHTFSTSLWDLMSLLADSLPTK